MKKILYLLATLALGALIVGFVLHALQSTTYVNTHGRDGTLVIHQSYGDARLATPLPLKQIHTYTATLEPRHEVVIQSDQILAEQRTYGIRFLTRDRADDARRARLRPVPGSIRLRTTDDPVPKKQDPAAAFTLIVDKAMGTVVVNPPAGSAHTLPTVSAGSVPFLLFERDQNLVEVLWANSRPGEWIFLLLALLLFNGLCQRAWNLPWSTRQSYAADDEHIHYSARVIEPTPQAPSPPPIGFKPGAGHKPEPPPLPSRTDGRPPLKLKQK